MNLRSRLLSSLLVFTLAACGTPTNPDAPPPGDTVSSDKQRLTIAAPPADLQQVVAGNTDFALDLYRQLGADEGNLFFSPHSISLALAMAYAGSAGATTSAFETTLHQGLPAAQFHRAMNDLDRQLTSRGATAKAADGQPFRLKIANQLFAQQGFPFEVPFLDTLAQEYGANVHLLDFLKASEPSRLQINDWVEQRTENRIKDLLAEGTITPDTRSVLVNTIYFNASWQKQFDPARTGTGAFTLLSGASKTVTMMRDDEMGARAAQVNGVEAVELPYDNDELSMLILMPPAGQLPALEQSLSATTLASYRAALTGQLLTLSMPRFEARTSASLNGPLTALGLGEAFSGSADFSKMTTADRLAITDVVHQAFVKVSETGTEAAAATAVVFGVTSIPQTRTVELNRPFVFLIQDKATGAVVFIGRLVEP